MTAVHGCRILLLALLAAASCARAQQSPLAGTLDPMVAEPLAAPAPGLSLAPQAAAPSAAWRLRVAPRKPSAKVETGWPHIETVAEPHGSARPSHRLELMQLGEDSSVLLMRKRTVTQIVWKMVLH